MHEIWKPIIEAPGYEVSDLGNIRSWKVRGHALSVSKEPKLKTPTADANGYMVVGLEGCMIGRLQLVHRVVAKAFIPNPENKPEVAHGDRDKSNNKVTNLRWASSWENHQDRYGHGTVIQGVDQHLAKLNDEGVRNIRRDFSAGTSVSELAKSHSVSRKCIRLVVDFKTWRHVL